MVDKVLQKICLLILLLFVSNIGADEASDLPSGATNVSEEKNTVEPEKEEVNYEKPDPTVIYDNSVIILTQENFDYVVNSKDIILVEFYAPWCGHCQKLAPEYEEASGILSMDTIPVALAKVDCTSQTEIATRFEVSGYPTLKYFKKGEKFDYDGPTDEQGIVNYMRKLADPNYIPPPEAVLNLKETDFDEIVNKEDLILVEFYAPWCGHCKQLAPEYEKAAQKLKEHDPPIPLAKVDATVETGLGTKHGVSGYPTLKLFRKGRATEYKGPRDEHGIVDYMQKQSGQASKLLKSLKEVKNYMNVDDVTVIGFFESDKDKLYETYIQTSDELRDEYTFGHVFDSSVRDHYKINPGSIVVFNAERFYTKFENKWHILSKADATVDEVMQFFSDHNVPLVGHMRSDNEQKRYGSKRPLCMIFFTVDWSFDHRDATQVWRKKFADVAKDYKDMTFVIADEDDFSNHIIEFGLAESGEEVNIGIFDKSGKKFAMDPMEEYEADDFREFLDKLKKGNISPHIKSQPVPKRQDGPVKIVVGKNFDKVVLDETKDVLIEIYAPWCGHCKQLEPKYKKLAKKLKAEKNLVIAKVDATANDLPTEYTAEGFPTIYFAPSNNKDKPLKYDGEREIDGFMKYLKEHATVSFGKGAKDEL